MADPVSALSRRRAHASQITGGTSEEAGYALFLRRIEDRRLAGDVLDFGAGAGYFSRRLLETGRFSSITAVDLMARPAGLPEEIRWVSHDLNERLPLPDEGFDVVTGVAIIEHLENPRFVARECLRLLRPGGAVLLSTPNNESWRALANLVVRRCFVDFGPLAYPGHISPILAIDFERVLREAGFTDIAIEYNDRGYVPRSRAVTWQGISRGRLRGVRWSDELVAIARRPVTEA
jgi:2-polyprenyl-3-methyl-5-hydroxy-6-metoxy-1,4-benzoquinol methylase